MKKEEIELPKYVSLDGIELRLSSRGYWRDAGMWGVGYKIKNGKLLSSHWRRGHDHLHGVELVEITKEEWLKGNGSYIDNDFK